MNITLFGMPLYGYGIGVALATALWFVGVLGCAKAKKIPCYLVLRFVVLAIMLGVAGARILYCVVNYETFTVYYENPWLMLRFFDGGYSLAGAWGGVLLAGYVASRKSAVSFASLADVACVPMGLWLCVARFFEQMTELGVGKVVENNWFTLHFPWLFIQETIGKTTEYRLMVYAYEGAVGLLLFCVLLLGFKQKKAQQPGHFALLFFAWYGATQIVMESMRDDGHMLIIFLRVAQLVCLSMPLVATGLAMKRTRPRLWCKVCLWGVQVVAVLGLVLLEFSLDGRITWGAPSLGRDYMLMTGICLLLALIPTVLLCKGQPNHDH